MVKLFGIFGFPLEHTLSPPMHQSAFRLLRFPALYLTLELDPPHFRSTFRNRSSILLDGFNVTVPYKEAVIPYLDWIDPVARGTGAVNLVKRRGKRLLGYNTDVYGFMEALKREGRFDPKEKQALILGAGGASRAVVFGLAQAGMKRIQIANRRLRRAVLLKRRFQRMFPRARFEAIPMNGEALQKALLQSDLLVNATSVGLKKDDPLLIPERLFPKKRMLVYDLIYNPPETKLLKVARERGALTLNGLGMLFYQAVRSFEVWTGRRAPRKEMRKVLIDHLHEMRISGAKTDFDRR